MSLATDCFVHVTGHATLQAFLQAHVPGSKYLASYRESILATFPARISFSAVVCIWQGCKMLHILVQQHYNHLKQGLEGCLAALTWLCMAWDGNNSNCMVWSAEAPNIVVWEVNIEEKKEPPHCHPAIVMTEMDAGIFLTWTTEAHHESTRPAREVCIIKQQILSRCLLRQNTVTAYPRWSCSKSKNI